MDKVKDYMESGKALQSKYDQIRTGILKRKNIFEEQYDPIIKPLKEISTNLKTTTPNTKEGLTDKQKEKLTKLIGPLAYDYLFNTNPSNRDVTFGLYSKNGVLYLGNLPITVEDNNIKLDDETFTGSEGLWELLTLKEPKSYNQDDLSAYEHLIIKSSSHRQRNDPNNPNFKASNGNKYKKIIKPMLTRRNLLRSRQPQTLSLAEEMGGSGLRKILSNTPVEYVYWNTLDELLDRLYVAWGSIQSGNTSPVLRNEVVNILQEIKEI